MDFKDIVNVVKYFRKFDFYKKKENLCIMHCVSAYPTPVEEANLATIGELARRLDCVIGLSDHTPDTTVATAAVALGAQIIEKHFCLARKSSHLIVHQPM